MNWEEYAHYAKEISEWGAEYHATLRNRPVRAQTAKGEIAKKIPAAAPENAESMDTILKDFQEKILPGVTH